VDRETGSHWGIEGRAVDGPLQGKTLRWLPGVQCRWFAWAAEYPETEIASVASESKQSTKAAAPPATRTSPARIALTSPERVSVETIRAWKKEGFESIALVLDEHCDASHYAALAREIAAENLKLYYWIEVARNPRLAAEHPEWMASLGMHADWQKRFSSAPLPKEGEVAKAFPWVPIGYRESFEAQLARVSVLLDRAASPFQGILLNDLQGGPASCGCGNLQCRWAIDYHVPATATKLDGGDTASRFVAEVRKLVGEKLVVPVWTTECEEGDLPQGRRAGGRTTGYCGNVPCAHGTCPKAFTAQWSSLVRSHPGPFGVLATHREFGRDGQEYGSPAGWIEQAIDYLDQTASKNGGDTASHDRLWIVVQGYDVSPDELAAARQTAAATGAGAIIVALTRIDQSYEPRIVQAK
jgi:hypothetical protein